MHLAVHCLCEFTFSFEQQDVLDNNRCLLYENSKSTLFLCMFIFCDHIQLNHTCKHNCCIAVKVLDHNYCIVVKYVVSHLKLPFVCNMREHFITEMV
jgi:hypothetical protein